MSSLTQLNDRTINQSPMNEGVTAQLMEMVRKHLVLLFCSFHGRKVKVAKDNSDVPDTQQN